MIMIGANLLIFLFLMCHHSQGVHSQVGKIDSLQYRSLYRSFRELTFNFIGSNSQDKYTLNYNKKMGKIQKEFSSSQPFFCDTTGPGARSKTVPDSVHKLTPGDIDIVGAFGDSLTAGNGALATNIVQVMMENKGLSWSIGGQRTWRQYLTLPNILKEYNPNLYGYSLGDAVSHQKVTKFNAAEVGAMSRDIPYMSRVLVRRIQADPKVDVQNHWKLITLLIGPNDFCADICYQKYPEKAPDYHEEHLVSALRTIRDNLPRTMVNVVRTPSMQVLANLKGLPYECVSMHVFECPCMFATRFRSQRKQYMKIQEKWQKRQFNVVYRDEFQNRTDFVVNLQTFTDNPEIPLKKNGLSDFSYLSMDCFHFSQRGYALASNALWNNMLETFNNKSTTWTKEFTNFKCPTVQRPYLATLQNSFS